MSSSGLRPVSADLIAAIRVGLSDAGHVDAFDALVSGYRLARSIESSRWYDRWLAVKVLEVFTAPVFDPAIRRVAEAGLERFEELPG